MSFEIAVPLKQLVTKSAFQEIIIGIGCQEATAHVVDLVHLKSPGLAEALAAHLALERFFFGMDESVVPEVVLPPEHVATDITAVRPLVRVGSDMDQQVVGLGELPVAEPTEEAAVFNCRFRVTPSLSFWGPMNALFAFLFLKLCLLFGFFQVDLFNVDTVMILLYFIGTHNERLHLAVVVVVVVLLHSFKCQLVRKEAKSKQTRVT